MVIIVFVRHGQSESNVNRILSHDLNSYPLTEEGREQSKRVARELKKLRVTKIYTSPVLRAYQTATIIGNELGLIPIIDDRLKERFLGSLNNVKFDHGDHWKLRLIRGEIEAKGLEPWESMKRRMVDFINSIPESESVVVAVSHYDPIRAVIGHILDLDDISAYGISLPNASMTVINYEKESGKFQIYSIGTPVISSALLSKLDRYIISTNIR